MAEAAHRVELTATVLERLHGVEAFLAEADAADAADALREYVHGDYLMLYCAIDSATTVYLLSIRHHRELSFDFTGLWTRSDRGVRPVPCRA